MLKRCGGQTGTITRLGVNKSTARYYDQTKWEVCCKCNDDEPKPVAKHTEDGAICHAHYQKDRYHNSDLWEECTKCKKDKPVALRINGQPVCPGCRQSMSPSPSHRSRRKQPLSPPVQVQPPKPKMSRRMVDNIDPTWKFCTPCNTSKPKVIIYSDQIGRCPTCGLKFIRARKIRRAASH